jgi:hypothetical protein
VTVAAESIATARSRLWAVTRDDVRQALEDLLERVQTDLSDHPQRAADDLLGYTLTTAFRPLGPVLILVDAHDAEEACRT